jgi:hypothetical protein
MYEQPNQSGQFYPHAQTPLPQLGSPEDALFQQKVKALIRANDDLRAQLQHQAQHIAFLERQCGDGGLLTHELSCLREENARLRREISLLQTLAGPGSSYHATPAATPAAMNPAAGPYSPVTGALVNPASAAATPAAGTYSPVTGALVNPASAAANPAALNPAATPAAGPYSPVTAPTPAYPSSLYTPRFPLAAPLTPAPAHSQPSVVFQFFPQNGA